MNTPTIEVTGVSKRFGARVALDDVTLRLGPGVTAMVGPNGAGKTTLLRVLATVAVPDQGDVRVGGRDPIRPDERIAVRRTLGYVPQDVIFPRRFTVYDFVEYVAVLKEVEDERRRGREVRQALDLLALGPLASRRLRSLSRGQRQRALLAQAVIGSPTLLVLDEPATALDAEHRLLVEGLLGTLGRRAAVVLATHSLEDLAVVADEVVVLHEGRVAFTGSPTQLAGLAAGRVWLAPPGAVTGRPPELVRRLPDGRARVVGSPPRGAEAVTSEAADGYALVTRGSGRPNR